MDLQGCGTLVEADKINKCMKLRSDAYTFDKFRHMSILSGCDYLENLPGVGLKKALKFISSIAGDTHDALVKLPAYLKLPNVTITNEYKEAFMLADATFKHQLIYDPVHKKLSRLNDPHGTDLKYCANAGDAFDDGVAFQLALGNIDPFTRAVHDDWSPDPSSTHASSIWATCYRKPPKLVEPSPKLNGPVTKGAKVNVTTKNGEFRPQTEEIKREPFRIKFSFKNKISKVDTQSVTTSRFFSKSGEKQNGYNMPNNELNKSSLEINYIQLKNNGVGVERQEIKSNVEDDQLASFKGKINFNKRRCVSTVPSALLQSETDVEKSTEGSVQNEGAIETQITRNVQLEDKTTRPKITSCRRLGLPRPKNKPRPKNLSIFGNMENSDSLLQ